MKTVFKLKSKQSLFIYERREVIVLVIIGLMVAFFTFTLGVHWGKRADSKIASSASRGLAAVHTMDDAVPSAPELKENEKVAQKELEESINQELVNQVKETGIKLDAHRQIDLPKRAKSKNAGATTLRPHSTPTTPKNKDKEKYSLQIGSYPSLGDAKVFSLSFSALKPFVREAKIEGKGKWFRVYVGNYPTRKLAEHMGARLRSQHKIKSYVVTKISE